MRCLVRATCAAAAVAALAVVSAMPLDAQGVTTSAVTGMVTSDAGTPLTGARVSVTDSRTGVTRRVSTNDVGRFYVAHLQPGGPYTSSPDPRLPARDSSGRAAQPRWD